MLSNIRIAISGKSGCGNSTVSRLVADKLGLKLINYTFRNMAEDLGISFEELRKRAENDDSYDRKLDLKQAELAEEGNCVLGSRLAIWILDDADLKVYLTASDKVRAERVASREGKTVEAALKETVERDRLDHGRYLRIYGIDNDDLSKADLVIDTEKHNAETVASIIKDAVESLHR
ncbi:MAG: cytidylate kinase [Spirochaetes bacterium]|nr:MAG: cytidylate kinase [Spirochaetota bacterium]